MVWVVLERSETIFMPKIFKNRFLDDPEYLPFPFFKDYAFVEDLGECPLPNIIGIYTKVVGGFRGRGPSFHEVFEPLNKLAGAGGLSGLEFDYCKIFYHGTKRPVFDHYKIEVADPGKTNLTENQDIVNRAKVGLGDIPKDDAFLQKPAGA